MPEQQAMKAVLQAYMDHMNSGDAEALIALFASDAVIEDPVGTPIKSGPAIAEWFREAVATRARITPIGPIRGSHGNAAAMAFIVTTGQAGRRVGIHSLDTCVFNEDGLITELKGYWGPGDIDA